MKQRILAGALLAAATLAGGSGAWAAAVERPLPVRAEGPGGGPGGKLPPGDHVDHMAMALGLSEAQQKQIKEILKNEHEKNSVLLERMGEFRKQLDAAERSAVFDEAAVRAIAAKQAQTEIELTVSRARTHHRINAVLTPEQRAQEQKLRASRGPRPGHKPPYQGER